MKISYDEYAIARKGRTYHILIPKQVPQEAWVSWHESCYDPDVAYWDGDRKFVEAIRNMAVTLTLYTDKIVYFPIKDNEPLGARWDGKEYDLVLYNHQIQLPRHQWTKIRRAIQHQKPKPFAVHVNFPSLLKKLDVQTEKWKNTKRYWNKKSQARNYLHGDTIFYESCRHLFGTIPGVLHDFLAEDLEQITWNQEWCTLCLACPGAVEIGFCNKKIAAHWKEIEDARQKV